MRFRTLAVAAASALAMSAFPTSAEAAATEASVLSCPEIDLSVSVTGFSRGEPLHVVGGTGNFIVTSAVINGTGQTVIDIPGQHNRGGIVTCTTTSPLGVDYTFKGFFTPA